MRIESSTYVTACNLIVFGCFNVDSRKPIKRECGRESIDAFSMTKKKHTFENALVWTGP